MSGLTDSTASRSLRERFESGAKWNLASAILSHAANFLTNVLIARLLGRETFGKFGIVQSTMFTSAGIALVATGITATQYVAQHRLTNKAKVGRVLGLCSTVTLVTGLIATLMIWFSAPWLADRALQSPQLTGDLRIAAAFIFFSVINGYQTGALSGLESFKSLAIASGLQGIFQLSVCCAGAWKWGLEGALFGLLATAVIRWAIFHILLRRDAAERGIAVLYSGIWQERSILTGFAIPAAICGMSAAPAIWFGNALLTRQRNGYSQMALFAAVFSFKSVTVFLPWVLNNVGMSILNSQKGIGDISGYRRIFWTNAAATASCAVFGALFVAGTGHYLLRIYGKSFSDAYPTLLILMASAVIETIGNAAFQIVQSREKMWLSLFSIVLPRDVGLIAAAYLLVPIHHAPGLGMAHLISSGIYLMMVLAVSTCLGLNWQQPSSTCAAPGVGFAASAAAILTGND